MSGWRRGTPIGPSLGFLRSPPLHAVAPPRMARAHAWALAIGGFAAGLVAGTAFGTLL